MKSMKRSARRKWFDEMTDEEKAAYIWHERWKTKMIMASAIALWLLGLVVMRWLA